MKFEVGDKVKIKSKDIFCEVVRVGFGCCTVKYRTPVFCVGEYLCENDDLTKVEHNELREGHDDDNKVDKVTLDFPDKESALKFFKGFVKMIDNMGGIEEFVLPYRWRNRRQDIEVSWGKEE